MTEQQAKTETAAAAPRKALIQTFVGRVVSDRRPAAREAPRRFAAESPASRWIDASGDAHGPGPPESSSESTSFP